MGREEEGKRFGGEDDPKVEEVKGKLAELESKDRRGCQ